VAVYLFKVKFGVLCEKVGGCFEGVAFVFFVLGFYK